MNKKILQLISLLLLTTQLHAQPLPKKLMGKWVYHSIRWIDEKEPVSQRLMQLTVGDSAYYQFLPNGRFRVCERSCVNGSWEVEDQNRLVLTTDEGRIQWYTLMKLEDDTLAINVRNKAVHTLTKDTGAIPFEHVSVEMKGTSRAKTNQLAKRWKLVKIVNEKEKPSTMESINRMFAGAIFDFGANNKCVITRTRERTGTWNLAYENTVIRILFEDEGELWQIVAITPDELILKRIAGDNLFRFSPY